AQERDVAADRLERARRIEQHEAVGEHEIEPLQRRDRVEVLLDRHLLEQHVEAALDAGFDAHVDEEEPGLAHAREQLGSTYSARQLIFHTVLSASPLSCSRPTSSSAQRRPFLPHSGKSSSWNRKTRTPWRRLRCSISSTTFSGLRTRTTLP